MINKKKSRKDQKEAQRPKVPLHLPYLWKFGNPNLYMDFAVTTPPRVSVRFEKFFGRNLGLGVLQIPAQQIRTGSFRPGGVVKVLGRGPF
jgi:hypothetical protein